MNAPKVVRWSATSGKFWDHHPIKVKIHVKIKNEPATKFFVSIKLLIALKSALDLRLL